MINPFEFSILKKKFLLIMLIFGISIFSFSLKIDDNRLEKKCRELEIQYGSFGLMMTDPQNGRTLFIYSKKVIREKIFCPGSLLKPFAIFSASKNRIIDRNEQYICKGYKDETDKICWLKTGHGKMNLVTGLSHSCNFYFFKFVQGKFDKSAYFDTLFEYGITDHKIVPKMNDTDFFLTSIGLGTSVISHPEEIMMAYNSFFNEGNLFDGSGAYVKNIEQPGYVVDILRSGMMQCYLYGTAKSIYDKTGITDVIAKTGTGINLDGGVEEEKNLVGWVVILYPSFNPTFSMVVVIKNRKSSVSCDIASDVLKYLMEKK